MTTHPANPDHATYAEWDAAYVLGALTASDRRDYEAHLQTCERCRASVAEIASLPGLLTRARPLLDEATDPASAHNPAAAPVELLGPPAELLDLVVAKEHRRVRKARRRIAFVSLGAAAVLVLGIGIPVALTRDAEAPAQIALEPVSDTEMTASVSFDSVAWGTKIAITCDYPADASWSGPGGTFTYSLVVTDTEGNTSEVATWEAVPGKTVHVDASTAVPIEEIATLQIQGYGGDVLLQTEL